MSISFNHKLTRSPLAPANLGISKYFGGPRFKLKPWLLFKTTVRRVLLTSLVYKKLIKKKTLMEPSHLFAALGF